jgi:hypothetical protein
MPFNAGGPTTAREEIMSDMMSADIGNVTERPQNNMGGRHIEFDQYATH